MPPSGQQQHRLYDVEVSVAILLVSCSKAEVVECPGRKLCWSADGSRRLLMGGSKRASINFAAGQRSEIGR